MGKSTQENYLDELLSSVNENKTPEELEMLSLKSQLQKMRDGVEDSWKVSSFAEEEFLRKFEQELEEEDLDSFLSEFEREVESGFDEDRLPKTKSLEEDFDLQIREEAEKNTKRKKKSAKEKTTGKEKRSRKKRDGKLETLENTQGMPDQTAAQANIAEKQNELETEAQTPEVGESDYIVDSIDEVVLEDVRRISSLAKQEEQTNETIDGIQAIDESDLSEFGEIIGEINAESDLSAAMGGETLLTPDGEIDLSGQSDRDLLDLLSGEGELSDLGNMLSGEGEVSDIDEIGDYADQQMQQAEEAQEESEQPAKKKKRFGRGRGEAGNGFLAKFINLLFGDEEEDEEEARVSEEIGMDGVDDIALTDENLRILDELAEEDAGGKKKGKKEKKSKKEKPKKEKPKKEKPKKAPKPKKEKQPKVTAPEKKGKKLPKAPVILIAATLAALVVVILLGTNQAGYNKSIADAKQILADAQKLQEREPERYIAGTYTKAVECLSGKKLKAGDEEFYQQIRILATVEAELDNYETFRAYGDEIAALDSLVCAAGRYSMHTEQAQEYQCTEQLEQIRAVIQRYLAEEYSMSLEEAIEMYNARTRKEYSEKIRLKLHELGLDEQ